ncbi:hypothetical protein NQ176_g3018 [Zarea fungicola]|uniref:Uncharacterized protein n=1 Tax=Zarea fungicola TaxID=93591 RepID=A0ACC1NLM3_9HYPO|nr:hypothetical protein NQ176_g3018 [Lecanicillium fungicola]
MFASAEHRTVDFDSGNQYIGRNPFPREMHLPVDDHATPAGLYSESIKLGEIDGAGEGFRLLLPFSLKGGDDGARLSDGSSVEEGSVADLFQHGLFPLGSGGGQRAQRLERLFDTWTQLVQRGVWAVGVDGVEGSMDVFKDAEGASSSDYWIPLDTTV